MDNPPEPVNTDLTPEQLAALRIRDPISTSERETFEAKIRELEYKIAELEEKLKEAKKTPAPPKKKSLAERFSPLG